MAGTVADRRADDHGGNRTPAATVERDRTEPDTGDTVVLGPLF